jgi:ATP-dependent Clp protease ATP-binding subunit ClpB
MDPNRLTTKSSEALHDAQAKAVRLGHTEVDAEHLLAALLEQPEGLVPRLLAQSSVDADKLRAELADGLARLPKVSGPGTPPGQVAITQRLARLLDEADREAGRLTQGRVRLRRAPATCLD